MQLGRKGYRYPVWQLDLVNLTENPIQAVSKELQAKDPWTLMNFFLNPSAALAGQTPLAVLRKSEAELNHVLQAARDQMQHGA